MDPKMAPNPTDGEQFQIADALTDTPWRKKLVKYTMGTCNKAPFLHESYTLQNSNLRNCYPKPEYLIIGSFGLLG